MDTNNYQWGYVSIYEDDAFSAAAAQLAAWKERLEMNAQVGYEEDALSAAAAQLAAWKESLEMNVIISPTCNTCGATHSTEGCPFTNDGVQYMEQYNYPLPNDMYSNTYNPDRWDYPNFLGSNDQNIQWPTNFPDFPQAMQQSQNESSLEELMAQCIQTQTVSLKNLETLMGQMTNTLVQLSSSQQLHENQEFGELPSNPTPDFSQPMQQQEDEPPLEDLLVPVAQTVSFRQPESFSSNTEPNSRHENRAQCPSMTVRSEVQPEPQTQNAEELESSSCSFPNPSPAMPTTQSPYKQPSFSEEKAPQVGIPTFPPMISSRKRKQGDE
ncbi:hypothetical protein ACLOJK_000605 [Asimina triloba]